MIREGFTNVLVLMGGPDAERDVSIVSGCAVANALRAAGEFRVDEKVIHRTTREELHAMKCDVIFPVLHGRWGEGGPLQDLLEQLGTPYVGSGPVAASMAMNKFATKQRMNQLGVQTPPAELLEPGQPCSIDPPLVLKPNDDGSSVDLRICRTNAEVESGRAELHPKRGVLLAERYIAGRELTVGVLVDDALPIIEIKPAVDFYDYQAKYHREDTRYVLEPSLPSGVQEQCVDAALRAFSALGCRDIARVDFMLDANVPWFLEINTMPGFTPHSLVPMAAQHLGRDMTQVCRELIHAAMNRCVTPVGT